MLDYKGHAVYKLAVLHGSTVITIQNILQDSLFTKHQMFHDKLVLLHVGKPLNNNNVNSKKSGYEKDDFEKMIVIVS